MGGLEALAAAQSYHGWWELAGVDNLVGEEPFNWLAKTSSIAPKSGDTASRTTDTAPTLPNIVTKRPEPVVQLPEPPAEMPDDWSAFQHWLAHDPHVPGCQWDQRRITPVGEAGAALMVLAACPEIDEQAAGALFCGAAGQLFDAMLGTIGLTRTQCYFAALALTRPPGGRLIDDAKAGLEPLLWHHLAIARPQRLLLIGNEISMMVAGSDVPTLRGNLRDINQDGVTVSAAAIMHPALLLARPALKSAAWDSLKRFNQRR